MTHYCKVGAVLLTRVRAVGHVSYVAEIALYLDTLGGVTFVCFDADGGKQSTPCAKLEGFLTHVAEVY